MRTHQPQMLGLIETKLKVNRREKLSVSLVFFNCFAAERVGLGGGLAVLWKEGVVVEVKNYSRYHVDLVVVSDSPYRFTLFYGIPGSNRGKASWDLLGRLGLEKRKDRSRNVRL